MGYDAALFVASVILLLPLLAIAGGILAAGRRFGWLPGGWASSAVFLLILFGTYTALYIGTAVSTLIVQPASLQRKFLGQQEAGIFALRRYQHDGFMDPSDEWEYIVSDGVRARLAGKCEYVARMLSQQRDCVLYSDRDSRWFAHVTLSANQLHIVEGLR